MQQILAQRSEVQNRSGTLRIKLLACSRGTPKGQKTRALKLRVDVPSSCTTPCGCRWRESSSANSVVFLIQPLHLQVHKFQHAERCGCHGPQFLDEPRAILALRLDLAEQVLIGPEQRRQPLWLRLHVQARFRSPARGSHVP